MTDPLLLPEPEPAERRVLRELIGFVLVVLGAAVLLFLLLTVDWRLPAGLLAAATIAGGIYLGRDRTDTEGV